MIILKKLKL